MQKTNIHAIFVAKFTAGAIDTWFKK